MSGLVSNVIVTEPSFSICIASFSSAVNLKLETVFLSIQALERRLHIVGHAHFFEMLQFQNWCQIRDFLVPWDGKLRQLRVTAYKVGKECVAVLTAAVHKHIRASKAMDLHSLQER